MTVLNQFARTIKQRVTTLDKKQQLILCAAVLLLAVFAYMFIVGRDKENTVVMQPVDTSNPTVVVDKLNVSEAKAKDTVKAIEKAREKPPTMSWTVTAKDTQEAAKVVEKQIKSKTAPPMPPADKTVVTPRETKVDVYRIDMDADWEIGVGYGNHDGKSYVPVEVQRNYAKHKAIAAEIHMDTGLRKVEGYEVKHVWRF